MSAGVKVQILFKGFRKNRNEEKVDYPGKGLSVNRKGVVTNSLVSDFSTGAAVPPEFRGPLQIPKHQAPSVWIEKKPNVVASRLIAMQHVGTTRKKGMPEKT